MEKAINFFNAASKKYLEEYERKTSEGYSFRVRREKTLAVIPEAKEGKKALDIGCGPGIMAEGLLEKNYSVACVDAAPSMINLVKEKFSSNPKITAGTGDVNELNFPDNSFDLIIAMGLLEYLGDQEKALQEIKRVAKTGGQIIITFPNKTSPCRIFNRSAAFLTKPFSKVLRKILKKPKQSLTHKEYTLKQTINFLEKNGLKVSKVIYYNFKLIPYPFDKWFPKFTIWQSKLFERLDNTFLKFLGTGFIIKARKQ